MRLRYIDFTRGFAIILMLFGHTMPKINVVHRWIYSFHMPIFFIICGILIITKEKRLDECNNCNFIKRIYKIGIPYYIFGILLNLFYTLLAYFANEPSKFGTRFFELLTFQGIDSLWFLPIYFFSETAMICLQKFKYNEKYRLLLSVVSFVLVCFLSEYMTSWYLDIFYKILLGICFIELGMLVAKSNIINKFSLLVNFCLLIVGCILSQINGDVEMAASNIGNPIVYFLSATMTAVAIMSLLKKLESRNNLFINNLEFFGKNSIVLLVTNNLLIEIIRLLDYKISGNILIKLGMFGCIIFTFILIMIEWRIIKISNGILAPIFGNIKKSKN